MRCTRKQKIYLVNENDLVLPEQLLILPIGGFLSYLCVLCALCVSVSSVVQTLSAFKSKADPTTGVHRALALITGEQAKYC